MDHLRYWKAFIINPEQSHNNETKESLIYRDDRDLTLPEFYVIKQFKLPLHSVSQI